MSSWRTPRTKFTDLVIYTHTKGGEKCPEQYPVELFPEPESWMEALSIRSVCKMMDFTPTAHKQKKYRAAISQGFYNYIRVYALSKRFRTTFDVRARDKDDFAQICSIKDYSTIFFLIHEYRYNTTHTLNLFTSACFEGDLVVVERIISKLDREDIFVGLRSACCGAQIQVVKMCIEATNISESEANDIFNNPSCHFTIFKYIKTVFPNIDKNQTLQCNFPFILQSAINNNDVESVKNILKKHQHLIGNHLLLYACEYGSYQIIKSILPLCDYYRDIDWSACMNNALLLNDDINVIKLLSKYSNHDWANILKICCLHEDVTVELILFIIKKGALCENLIDALYFACQKEDNYWLVDLLIENGWHNYDSGLFGACFTDNIKMAKRMIRYGATEINTGFQYACRGRSYKACLYLIGLGADDFDVCLCTTTDSCIKNLLLNCIADRDNGKVVNVNNYKLTRSWW
ncbi:hypothetical protein AKO1_007569 [Acrasis kona]|uniref:Ankyrin repeat protein n=1 Tax=Acrasis kona TaxID=1008807 RepID=A0AAW2YQ77_9EUKA